MLVWYGTWNVSPKRRVRVLGTILFIECTVVGIVRLYLHTIPHLDDPIVTITEGFLVACHWELVEPVLTKERIGLGYLVRLVQRQKIWSCARIIGRQLKQNLVGEQNMSGLMGASM